MRATVYGNGSWGTAFAMILADAGNEVTMWGFEPDVVQAINAIHENPVYHPGIPLPESIKATTDPAEAVQGAELIVLAVPAQTLRTNLAAWKDLFPPESIVVSLSKGIEMSTGLRMTEVVAEAAEIPAERVVVVSGPNLAGELIHRQPAGTTVACVDEEVAKKVQAAIHNEYLRPYTTSDVIGTEICGAVKNVIALATGVAAGLGYGDNSKSTVITRGLVETTRLGVAMGADVFTFTSLAGLGDLIATCMSPLSRNTSFGIKLGQGLSVDEIAASTSQVAEGVKSCQPIAELAAKYGVEMPIVENVAKVVRGEATPAEMVRALISREIKSETPDLPRPAPGATPE
jgi:glycerol-3-phosphate dehydrogenase (NAD(P)+)